MPWINLTPHAVRLFSPDGKLAAEVPPSGAVARVATTNIHRHTIDGVAVFAQATGAVTGLPDFDPAAADRRYIVSLAVRQAVPHRRDVFSPGELLRGANGQPIGAVGLIGNF